MDLKGEKIKAKGSIILKKHNTSHLSMNVIFFIKTGLNELKTEYNFLFAINMLHIKTNIL